MKKPLVLASIAVLAVLVAGAGFAAFWTYSAARDVREYLPAQPRIAGVTIAPRQSALAAVSRAAASDLAPHPLAPPQMLLASLSRS